MTQQHTTTHQRCAPHNPRETHLHSTNSSGVGSASLRRSGSAGDADPVGALSIGPGTARRAASGGSGGGGAAGALGKRPERSASMVSGRTESQTTGRRNSASTASFPPIAGEDDVNEGVEEDLAAYFHYLTAGEAPGGPAAPAAVPAAEDGCPRACGIRAAADDTEGGERVTGRGLHSFPFPLLETCLTHKSTIHILNTTSKTRYTTPTRTPHPITSAQVEL